MPVVATTIEQNVRHRPNVRYDNVHLGMHRFSHGKYRHLVYTSAHVYLIEWERCRKKNVLIKDMSIEIDNW